MKTVELVEVWAHHIDVDLCRVYRINRKGQRRLHEVQMLDCRSEYDGSPCAAARP